MEQAQYVSLLEMLNKLSTKVDKVIALSLPASAENAYRSLELKELFAALAKAQSEMGYASLNKTNAYFDTRYADIVAVIKASRPSLTKNGLAVTQEIKLTEDGQSILHTLLTHASGQWMESRARILPPKNDIQTMHSYISDLKKLCYSSLVGVAVEGEDDDGEIAMIDARQIVAKGPSNDYNPKEQNYDVITKEQREEIEYELASFDEGSYVAEEIMSGLRIQSLADMPKNKYNVSIRRIRKIKGIRNGTIKPDNIEKV